MSYDFFVVKGLIGEHASFCFFLGGCLARESVAFHAVESMLRCLSYWMNHDSVAFLSEENNDTASLVYNTIVTK